MTPIGSGQAKLSYWVNRQGTILKIEGPWDAWLSQDGEVPERCRAANVVGSRLFSFIENEGVRCVYDAMQRRIYETGNRLVFPFRCDSAWLRREMQMSIARDGDMLRYDSVI